MSFDCSIDRFSRFDRYSISHSITLFQAARRYTNFVSAYNYCENINVIADLCLLLQGTRGAKEVIILTVHDLGCDREYFHVFTITYWPAYF